MPDWSDIDADPGRPRALDWDRYALEASGSWKDLLDREPAESALQEFLEQNPSFLPGGNDQLKLAGHHGTNYDAVFSQPSLRGLRRERVPDFMWINASSAEWTPVCIEIERPAKKWFTKDGNPTAALTQARTQLNEWQAWFDQAPNVMIFRSSYLEDRFRHRVLRPVYVLAFGRHKEFELPNGVHKDPQALLAVRSNLQRPDESYMSLDSLKPSKSLSNAVTLKMGPAGPELFAIPPTFETGPAMADLARRFRDPAAALARTSGWPAGRQSYVATRWSHWQAVADQGDDMVINPLLPYAE